jgi:hypothetical protein
MARQELQAGGVDGSEVDLARRRLRRGRGGLLPAAARAAQQRED